MGITAVGSCLFAGGPGQLAQLCEPADGITTGAGVAWEALQGAGGFGVVRAVVPALAAPPQAQAADPAGQCGATQCGA